MSTAYFEHIKRYYGVEYKRGMRVEVDGKPGIITGSDGRLLVRFDGMKFSLPCHPKWRVEIIGQ